MRNKAESTTESVAGGGTSWWNFVVCGWGLGLFPSGCVIRSPVEKHLFTDTCKSSIVSFPLNICVF